MALTGQVGRSDLAIMIEILHICQFFFFFYFFKEDQSKIKTLYYEKPGSARLCSLYFSFAAVTKDGNITSYIYDSAAGEALFCTYMNKKNRIWFNRTQLLTI